MTRLLGAALASIAIVLLASCSREAPPIVAVTAPVRLDSSVQSAPAITLAFDIATPYIMLEDPGTITFCTDSGCVVLHRDGTISYAGTLPRATQEFMEAVAVAFPGYIDALCASRSGEVRE